MKMINVIFNIKKNTTNVKVINFKKVAKGSGVHLWAENMLMFSMPGGAILYKSDNWPIL